MIKTEELSNPHSCLNKAKATELIFVLLERDDAAAKTVRFWCCERINIGKNKFDDPQIQEALNWAYEVDAEVIEDLVGLCDYLGLEQIDD